ncbi:MAG: ABC transporter permease [Elusimicrobiota bacterium]
MIVYLFKRLLSIIPILIGITFLTYLVIVLSPGGPVSFMNDFNPKISQEYKQKMVEIYGLNKPIHQQYFNWVKKVIRLDFGETRKDNQPVIKKIKERLPKTVLLSGFSMLIAFFLAIPIGVFSAMHKDSLWDKALTVFVFIGFSIPTYWVALLLMIGVGIHLGWLPLVGFRSLFYENLSPFGKMIDIARHLALPLFVTSITSLAGLSRYIRNGMLEVSKQDYIRTARSKGLSEARVIWGHGFRNTLLQLITIVGLSIPELLSAGVIFETIFSYPGLGRLAFEAVMTRDMPLIMATVTIGAIATLLGNLAADIAYAYADPRIRAQ